MKRLFQTKEGVYHLKKPWEIYNSRCKICLEGRHQELEIKNYTDFKTYLVFHGPAEDPSDGACEGNELPS